MESEYLEVAYINWDKAILHGRVNAGRDAYGVNLEREIEIVLSDEQKELIVDMNERHRMEMRKLLRGFVA